MCQPLLTSWTAGGLLRGFCASLLSATVFLLSIAKPLECAVPGSAVGLSCRGAPTLLTYLSAVDGDRRRGEEIWASSLATCDLWELPAPRLPWCPLSTMSPLRLSSGPAWSPGFRCYAQDGSWRPWWSPTIGILGKHLLWTDPELTSFSSGVTFDSYRMWLWKNHPGLAQSRSSSLAFLLTLRARKAGP